MKNVILLAVVLLFASRIGTLAADPIESFTKELLVRADEQYWWGIKEDKPAGGYLFKLEYDVTGDGRNEVFVASSLEEDEGAYAWSVYSPDTQQNYVKIASGVVVPPVHGFYFKVNGSQRELQLVYRNPKFGLAVIDRYAIAVNGSVTRSTQELTTDQILQLDASNWKESFAIGNEVKPTISKVLLAEYANNHAVQWRAFKNDLGVTEQNQDPADARAIGENSGFTLQNAKQLEGVR
jgi:hypothetical protein